MNFHEQLEEPYYSDLARGLINEITRQKYCDFKYMKSGDIIVWKNRVGYHRQFKTIVISIEDIENGHIKMILKRIIN